MARNHNDDNPHDATETLYEKAVRQTRENEAAKKAAKEKRKARERRQSKEICRRLPRHIRLHIQNGGGLPFKIPLHYPLALELLETQKDGSLSEVGQEFYQELADMGITQEKVGITWYEIDEKGCDDDCDDDCDDNLVVGCITIKHP